MRAEQLELFSQTGSGTLEEDARLIENYLYTQGGWRTRRDISAALGWKDHARIRHAAEATGGAVIFGQRGMRHVRNASKDEFERCLKVLNSQVRAMQQRVLNTEKKFYAYGGGRRKHEV
ncbi:MAG TPA: hypothetical protein P5169_07550 [Kiritimatiellia bacterium]|jgi:hypothetical protein|nr:hypothetical protein [Kiritimatiellia bacterium]